MARCPTCHTLLGLDGYCAVCHMTDARCHRHGAKPGERCRADLAACDVRQYDSHQLWRDERRKAS